MEAWRDPERLRDIPEYMWDGLVDYIDRGYIPGGFLHAVLSNDLRLACRSADPVNRHKLYEYFFFLYNWAPAECWGSPENVRAWQKAGGYQGKYKNREPQVTQ